MPELTLTINGERHDVDVPVDRSLAAVLRDDLGLTGTKVACNEGHCGACTVQVDGVHPLVGAFVRADAVQCGFCTPGQVASAAALVEANPRPSRDEIRHAMSGNLCRCGTYPKIEEAISSWQG